MIHNLTIYCLNWVYHDNWMNLTLRDYMKLLLWKFVHVYIFSKLLLHLQGRLD